MREHMCMYMFPSKKAGNYKSRNFRRGINKEGISNAQ